MNKKLFFAALATTAMVTSCMDDDLGVKVNGNLNTDGRISFTQKVGNMTRATQQAQNVGHYEFGVSAFKGATKGGATTEVMDNYLVGYGNTTNLYKTLKDQASTWGNNAGGNYTDIENKVSSWFYEGIGKGTAGDDYSWGHTNYTTPDNNQILKYWDKNQAWHDFYAFAPYAGQDAATATNPVQVYCSAATNTLTIMALNAFSTSEDSKLTSTDKHQVVGARTNAADAIETGTNYTNYNNELKNYNEGLYAVTSVAKADYDKDVELTFKHLNSRINIKFYEEIKGYKVRLIDLVPAGTVGPAGTLAEAKGVQFSPATLKQSEETMNDQQPAKAKLPVYYRKATYTIGNLVEGSTETLAVSGEATNDNLVFQATNNATPVSVPGLSGTYNIIGEDRSHATASATTMYALSKYYNGAYITPASTTQYNYYAAAAQQNGETEAKVGDKTGYTLHVSFEMIPQDGSSVIRIYDARVHVAAEYCKWEPGKAYTYIFKITDRANGVTDPTTVDPQAGGTTPWIDPEDPRVPDDPILSPIVFDGVMVTDYDEVNTGKENDVDEWVISDPDSWTFFLAGGTGDKTYYDNSGVYGKAAVADILNRFNIAASPITSVKWNETNKNFDVDHNDGAATTVPYKASSYTSVTRTFSDWKTRLGANLTFAAGTADEVKAIATTPGTMEITIAKPTFNIWSTANKAVPYVTTPATIELAAYDVKYLVTTEFTTSASVTYELGKYINAATYATLTAGEKANVTVTAKFKPTVTYQTTAITAGSAATANSAYLIVTKK